MKSDTNRSSATGIDSNILVYAFDATDKKKHVKAMQIVKACWHGKERLWVTAQSLMEFFTVVTQKVEFPIPPDIAEQIVNLIVESPNWLIASYDEKRVVQVIARNKHKKRLWDALIATTLQEHGVTTIYTENVNDFADTGIKAINPFM